MSGGGGGDSYQQASQIRHSFSICFSSSTILCTIMMYIYTNHPKIRLILYIWYIRAIVYSVCFEVISDDSNFL